MDRYDRQLCKLTRLTMKIVHHNSQVINTHIKNLIQIIADKKMNAEQKLEMFQDNILAFLEKNIGWHDTKSVTFENKEKLASIDLDTIYDQFDYIENQIINEMIVEMCKPEKKYTQLLKLIGNALKNENSDQQKIMEIKRSLIQNS